MSNKVVVAGVGMIPFTPPGASDPYLLMGVRAAKAALADADIRYALVQQAYASYVHGDSMSGQAVLYGVGPTGIPIVNVNNQCASGSTALFLARQAVASGALDCVLALGFEQIASQPCESAWPDRPAPLARFLQAAGEIAGFAPNLPLAMQLSGLAAQAYRTKYGIAPETFARIAVKARAHAAMNPLAMWREPVTLADVLASAPVFGPLTQLQCSVPASGAAAVVLCSEAFARRRGIDARVVVAGQALATDRNSSFDEGDPQKVAGYDMTRSAAQQAYEQAGLGPRDIDVAELHDSFTPNELFACEGLGFAPEGGGEQFVLDGDNTYGGRLVVNPSGGLLAMGHPAGATGLAQCCELTHQLRGRAGARQVEGSRVALQHNMGLGGACVVTLYQRQ